MFKVIVYIFAAIGALVVAFLALTIYTYNFAPGATSGSEAVRAKQNVRAMATALEYYALDAYDFPTEEQGLNVLIERPADLPTGASYREGGYLVKDVLPIDPWGNEYAYERPAERSSRPYDLYSLGPDGVKSEDDIGNWGE